MRPILYRRTKRVHDRAVRCYLTLACPLACEHCSAGVPALPPARRTVSIPPAVWAEGINRRARHAILGGGEPLAYAGIAELCRRIDPAIRLSIYTNALPPVAEVLAVGRAIDWLISCHAGMEDHPTWLAHVLAVLNAGQRVRFHLVKDAHWRERFAWLRAHVRHYRITACDDQRSGPKSRPPQRRVRCTCYCELYGPDGRRYPCVTLLVRGEQPQEAIWQPDGPDGFTRDCDYFGTCVGCDNNIEGEAYAI